MSPQEAIISNNYHSLPHGQIASSGENDIYDICKTQILYTLRRVLLRLFLLFK